MKSQNAALLNDFIGYCEKHPQERFWQALRNWSSWSYILAGTSYLDLTIIPPQHIKDTFFWRDCGGLGI